MSLLQPLQLSTCTLKNNILLAPMDGITNAPFRLLCFEFGAGATYTEMINAVALSRRVPATMARIERADGEGIVIAQLSGREPGSFFKAALVLEEAGFNGIDINMGCPAKRIAGKGCGAALLREPKLALEIVHAVVEAVKLPVTIKLRSGWDEDTINGLSICTEAQRLGIAGVALHPRTKKQGFGGKADWSLIGEFKEALSIPVIGSGDLFTPQDVQRMLKETGCDGVMIARGAIGNPWIFNQTIELLESGGTCPVVNAGLRERLRVVLRHLELLEQHIKYRVAGRFKYHVKGYFKGLTGASRLRNDLYKCKEVAAMKEILLSYFRNY